MKRRDFLKQGLAAVAATHLPVALASELATSLPTARADWRLGWRSVEASEFSPMSLQIDGKLPDAVRGVLYRNGPAKTERASVRYQHWFDGDGMIQRFVIGDGGIAHEGQFVQTDKFREEEAAGRFLYSAAGTVIHDGKGSRNNDSGNVANTALLPWNDELLALWEGGSAYRVDPETLATIGRKDWRDDLRHMPFSAHPLVDRDGSLWNFGSAPYAGRDGSIFIYQIGADGQVRKAQRVATPTASYAHSFLMTDRWLVVYLGAHVFSRGADTFVDAFQWTPDVGSRVLLIDKEDLSQQKIIEIPAGFVFHGAHAFDYGDDIIARVSLYADAGVMDSGMIALMASAENENIEYPTFSRAYLATLRISPKQGRAIVENTDTLMEFPGIDTRFGEESTRVFGVGHEDETHATTSDAIVAVDPETGTVDRYAFGEHHIVEEPLFVPDESDQPNAGWLVGTFLDYGREQSGVYVLNASNLSDGPVALARMDRALPLGFHGCFIAS
ncbi:MAG: carotenoid oxygenase family protein [Pseudomonadota bacterium]